MNDENENQSVPWISWEFVVTLVVMIGILAAIAVPSFLKARDSSQQGACLNHLRIIDSGKEQAAMKYKLTDGDTIASTQVNQFVKGNTTPVCPSGGTYAYRIVGLEPTCSITKPRLHDMP